MFVYLSSEDKLNMEKVVIQKIKNTSGDVYTLAERYYGIMSVINDLKLTQREIQLVAFTAIKGNMSYTNFREEFCNIHETTPPTINNIISRLKKLGVLIKIDGKVKVNPIILLDFGLDVILEIKLEHGNE